MKDVYVMGSTRHVFRYKIGISKNAEKRAKWITNSIEGDAYVIFHASYFEAEKIEKVMHRVYKPFSAKMYGSGKTEWFWLFLPVTPILILITIWMIQRAFVFAIPVTIVYFLTK